MKTILIIRSSSLGDIVQCMSILLPLKRRFPLCKISWLVKENFKDLLLSNDHVDTLYTISKEDGLLELIKLGWFLRKKNFDLIYDAHSSIRSCILKLILMFSLKSQIIIRKKDRFKRFLLFQLRINQFPQPFKGRISYLKPLEKLSIDTKFHKQKWNFSDAIKDRVYERLQGRTNYHCLVPSAAWELKKWPIESWIELIKINTDKTFVVLGGPQDYFCQDLEEIFPKQVLNLAGKLSLLESCFTLWIAKSVIAGDTGLLHVADSMGLPGHALYGPTAFGETSSDTLKIIKSHLPCMPCSKEGSGSCSQKIYKQCLVEIKAEQILL